MQNREKSIAHPRCVRSEDVAADDRFNLGQRFHGCNIRRLCGTRRRMRSVPDKAATRRLAYRYYEESLAASLATSGVSQDQAILREPESTASQGGGHA